MKKKRIRIKIQSYDYRMLDKSVVNIIEVAKGTGANIVGPIPLPTKKEIFTILRAVHKYKDSREQFELRTHKRLIEIWNFNRDTMDVLQRMALPSGVNIEIKL